MMLWLLRPVRWDEYQLFNSDDAVDPRFSWDCNWGFIVRAANEDEARHFAAASKGDEGPLTWLDPEITTCVPLTDVGDHGVVMSDFHAG